MASYFPSRLSDLAVFFTNMRALIGDSPTVYGLTAAQGETFVTKATVFLELFNQTEKPDERTPALIEARDDAKKDLVAYTRKIVGIIQDQPTTTNQMRAALGITIREPSVTPVPPPTRAPQLDVTAVTGWTVKLRVHDGSGNRRKPDGVQGANIFSFIGDQPPTELAAWKFEGGISKTTGTVEFDHTLAPGTKVYLTAFWFNPRLQSGPACTPVPTQINYGGLSQAA